MGNLHKQDQTKGLAPNMPLGAAFSTEQEQVSMRMFERNWENIWHITS
jgi:hypothetical protein